MTTISAEQISRTRFPLNSEPTLPNLIGLFITPNEHLFNRNHGPFTVLNDEAPIAVQLSPTITPLSHPHAFASPAVDLDRLTISISALKALPSTTVAATLICAGNRRFEMAAARPVEGVIWDRGVIGNANWKGTKLRELLIQFGVKDNTDLEAMENYDGLHVHFESDQLCEEEVQKQDYSVSIPLAYAM